jgi:uncharacterized membrane protein
MIVRICLVVVFPVCCLIVAFKWVNVRMYRYCEVTIGLGDMLRIVLDRDVLESYEGVPGS